MKRLALTALIAAGCSYPGLQQTTLEAPTDSTLTQEPDYGLNPLDPLNPLSIYNPSSPFYIFQPQEIISLPPIPAIPNLTHPIYPVDIYSPPPSQHFPPNVYMPQSTPQGPQNLGWAPDPYSQTTPRP